MTRDADETTARRAIEKITANKEANRELAEARDRAMARMHLIGGLSQAEVARRVGVSESAVRLAVRLYGADVQTDQADSLQAVG